MAGAPLIDSTGHTSDAGARHGESLSRTWIVVLWTSLAAALIAGPAASLLEALITGWPSWGPLELATLAATLSVPTFIVLAVSGYQVHVTIRGYVSALDGATPSAQAPLRRGGALLVFWHGLLSAMLLGATLLLYLDGASIGSVLPPPLAGFFTGYGAMDRLLWAWGLVLLVALPIHILGLRRASRRLAAASEGNP